MSIFMTFSTYIDIFDESFSEEKFLPDLVHEI